MKFVKHCAPTMGIYVEFVDNDMYGRKEIEWSFNLAENPELAEQYLAWLAEGNTPESCNPTEATA